MYESRVKKIIDILSADDEYHTSSEIADKIGVSSKTIRLEINNLNPILIKNGAEIELKPGKGCKLNIIDKLKYEKFLKTEWLNIAYIMNDFNNPQTRELFILRRLLFTTEYIKKNDLSSRMNISLSQLNNDLKNVKEILKRYHIKIESKPYYGMKALGKELDKRLCLAESFNLDGQYEHYLIVTKDPQDHSLIDYIRRVINEVLNKWSYSMSKTAFRSLTIHIFILVKRTYHGGSAILTEKDFNELRSQHVYLIAEDIIKKLEHKLHINFNKYEVGYISIHLLGKKTNTTYNPKSTDYEVNCLVDKMLLRIKENYCIDLTNDYELKKSLVLHIVPVIERIKYGLVMKNPLLNEIKKDYISYECARTGLEVIEKYYNCKLKDDEIAYIALHISLGFLRINKKNKKKNVLIVCSTGEGTAKIISYQLTATFHNLIDHLDFCDYLELKKRDLNIYDLIISTVKLNYKQNIPFLQVGPYLNNEDMKKIQYFLTDRDNLYKIESLLKEDLFIKESTPSLDYLDVLKNISKKIESIKTNMDNLYDNIIARENIGSTSLGNGIAIPHPLSPISSETFMTIYINEQGITWEDTIVYIIILMNIKQNDQSRELELFLTQLSKFMCEKKYIKKVKKANTLREFIDYFINI